MDRRGIITAEFIITTIIIFVIVSSVISVVSERIDVASSTAMYGNARMTAEYVAGAINKVYSGGHGHAVTLSLPANISDKSYVIRVNSSGVFVLIDGKTGKSFINPKRISPRTFNMRGNQSYIIRNVKGADRNTRIVISRI